MDDRTCSAEDCIRPSRRGNTICASHYNKQWRERQGPCSVGGCERQAGQRKMCSAHYQRWRKGEDWQAPIPQYMKRGGACGVEKCGRAVQARGYCTMHYQRHLNGDVGTVERRKAESGQGSTDKKGYRYIYIDGRKVAEHRYVMQQTLGRPMHRFETPHHKNGRRADNRPENLELWVKPQAAGQRVADLVAFVAKYYPDEVRKALA